MRIYQSCYNLMSEMARDLYEMGIETHPKSMQNKNVEMDENFKTKELICQQYCLMSIEDEEYLFKYSESKDWAEAEFRERVTTTHSDLHINPGEAYKLREKIWDNFLVNGKFDYTYNERIGYRVDDETNLHTVVKELARNHDTRQAVLPIYSLTDVKNIGGKKRVPCSMYYNFMIRENASGQKVLHVCYHQRSSDFITHFGNDVYLAFRLMQHVAALVGIRPGYLYHTIDSLHSYKKDWVQLKTSLNQR